MQNLDLAIGQFYRRHTHVKRFFEGLHNPEAAQMAILTKIIKSNRDSAFGKAHGFANIETYADFKSRVPQARYEGLEPYIDRLRKGEKKQLTQEDPFMFATTSGTTNRPKFIPVTESHLKTYTHAFQVHNYQMIEDNPRTARSGKFLIISSNDEEGRTECGLPFGAISGLLHKRQSPLVKRHFALPYELCKVKQVDLKYYLLLRAAIGQEVAAILGCNPSSFLLLADQMRSRSELLIKQLFDGTCGVDGLGCELLPRHIIDAFKPYFKADRDKARHLSRLLDAKGQLLPKDVWPYLKVMSLWKGGSMGFYLEKLPELFGDIPTRDFGYMASEGRGTVPLSDQGAGGPLAVTSHFFEFVPEEDYDPDKPSTNFLMAHQLQAGRRYYIHFTTAAGLFRYNINDLMEVEGFHASTPILRFVRKGGGISSITGEKLSEEQVLEALKLSIPILDRFSLEHCTVAARLGHPPYYRCFAESNAQLTSEFLEDNPTLKDNLNRFLFGFDHELQKINPEYADKRQTKRLGLPRLSAVPPGTHIRLRQERVLQGAPEAQVKIPLLATDPGFLAMLEKIFPMGLPEYCLQNGLTQVNIANIREGGS
jgi:GH3 auxin-responsive promoter